MKVQRTPRGFEIVEFVDICEKECSIQQSSIVLETGSNPKPGTSALWLGTNDNRMHLDKSLAQQIASLLTLWHDTGTLDHDSKQEQRLKPPWLHAESLERLEYVSLYPAFADPVPEDNCLLGKALMIGSGGKVILTKLGWDLLSAWEVVDGEVSKIR